MKASETFALFELARRDRLANRRLHRPLAAARPFHPRRDRLPLPAEVRYGWRMLPRVRSAVPTCAALLSLLGGCSGPPPPKAPELVPPPIDATSELTRYLPLEPGTVFSYDTTSESTGTRGLLIVQITRPREGRVDLKMGAKTERLELVPDGVAYVEGGYLLKAPIERGRTWRSKTGTVRLEAVDQSVVVPAGHFEGCLLTVEDSRDPGASRTIRTTICPHVGLVAIDVVADSDSGHERETASLHSFGPRVDVASGESTTTTTTEEAEAPTTAQ